MMKMWGDLCILDFRGGTLMQFRCKRIVCIFDRLEF